jgi:hypothetical protein
MAGTGEAAKLPRKIDLRVVNLRLRGIGVIDANQEVSVGACRIAAGIGRVIGSFLLSRVVVARRGLHITEEAIAQVKHALGGERLAQLPRLIFTDRSIREELRRLWARHIERYEMCGIP